MKTVADIRVENLLLLKQAAGSLQALANLVEKSHSHLSQIKTRAGHSHDKAKPRKMGDKVAADFVAKLALEDGWMDNNHTQAEADAVIVQARRRREQGRPAEPAPMSAKALAQRLADAFAELDERFPDGGTRLGFYQQLMMMIQQRPHMGQATQGEAAPPQQQPSAQRERGLQTPSDTGRVPS